MSGDRKIHVGSRKSELALIQTNYVISLLKDLHPNKEFEIITMNTLGDKVLDVPLPKIGEKSLFTKELEIALKTGCVDFVVHSLKDLPTVLPENLAIGAVLSREDPRDALVLHKDYNDLTLSSLPKNSTIGTSSLRRCAQLSRKHPHLKVESIRGNLNTRLKKLDDLGKYQGIILAAAGLQRMGWNHRISKIIDSEELLYAVGQGALAVECREKDEETLQLLKPLYDIPTALRIVAERSFLKTLGGGCSAPVAVISNFILIENKYKLNLCGAVWSLDGKDEVLENEESLLEVEKWKMCDKCPFSGSENLKEGICLKSNCSKIDKECLEKCSPMKNSNEYCSNKTEYDTNKTIGERTEKTKDVLFEESKPTKKLKTDHSGAEEINIDLLKSDPHNNCPLNIPVGFDFMGKCPYLDSSLINNTKNKCPVGGKVDSENFDVLKCTFFKENSESSRVETQKVSEESKMEKNVRESDSNTESTNLFCGLVIHPDAPRNIFEESKKLGQRLAHKLIEKGAAEIMVKAQDFIRNSI